MATVVEVLTASTPNSPMKSHLRIRAVAGRGLEGDRYFLGAGTFSPPTRKPDYETTLIEKENIAAFVAESGRTFTAQDARRNVVTEGIALNDLVGREFLVGGVRLKGVRLCEPCNYLAKQTHPEVLRGLVHKGGLRAAILTDGFIQVGDLIAASA
jgi:ribosomal protein S12